MTGLLGTPASAEIISETGSLKEFFLGSEPGCAYDNFVTHLVEGIARPGYNAYNPLDPQHQGFGAYVPITSDAAGDQLLADWKQLFTYMMEEEWQAAEDHRQTHLAALPYDIVHLTETGTDREYYLVRERLDPSFVDTNAVGAEDDEIGSFSHGWGLYIYAAEPEQNRVCIQVVHPNDDYVTPYVAFDMFELLGARCFFFSSVGREVLWTNQGTYDNTKSLCDPSRNGRTVYQTAWEAFVDHLVDEEQDQPFMAQVHSYDTGTRNFSSAIVSPGRYDGSFMLPLYDWSGMVGGMVDRTPWIVHPAGFIGNRNDVTLTQFYGSSSSVPLQVYDDGGAQHLIPNPLDLYGHPENMQINYRYDLVDACSDDEWSLHVELDELPNCIDDDTTEYEFYSGAGFPVSYRNFEAITHYYHPMIEHLREALEEMRGIRRDIAPTTPTNLRVTAVNDNRVSLAWQRSGHPFFHSYRIYWDLNPNIGPESPYVDRDDPGAAGLCAQTTESVTIDPGLLYDFDHYVAVTGVSRTGRESAFSEVVQVRTENTDPRWIWIVHPNGQGISFVDSTETIAWNPGTVGGTVRIELSRFGMEGPWEVLAESTPNDSLFDYLVTGPPSEQCRIAISSVEDPAQNDTSDTDFTIVIARSLLASSFETVSFDWTHSAPGGWNDNWHQSTERARSGVRSFKCGSTGTGTYSNLCDSRLTHVPIANIPANTRLRFHYQIQVELAGNPFYCYDGAVIEISVDGGAFQPLIPLGGYPNRFVSPGQGPMPGRDCWGATRTQWEQVDVSLDAYAGHDIRVQWRFGSDHSVGSEGWYIDDVHFYEALLATPGPSTVTAYRGGDSIILRWEEDEFASYRIFSAATPDGPFDRFEGETTGNEFTVAGGMTHNTRFYMIYGEHAPPAR